MEPHPRSAGKSFECFNSNSNAVLKLQNHQVLLVPKFSRADPHVPAQRRGDESDEGTQKCAPNAAATGSTWLKPRPARRYFPGTPEGQALAAALEAQHHQSDSAPSWAKPLCVRG